VTFAEFLQHLDHNPPELGAHMFARYAGDPHTSAVQRVHVDADGDVILTLENEL
jgi:hypothetical protein